MEFTISVTNLPPQIRGLIEAAKRPSGNRFGDALRWDFEPDGHFTTRCAYSCLNAKEDDGGDDWIWTQLWCMKLHEKVKFMFWLALHKVLPVNGYRFHCKIAQSAAYGRCSSPLEDMLHCF